MDIKTETIKSLSQQAIDYALKNGATQAEIGISCAEGLHVNVRQQEVDTLEFTKDKGVSITVYRGKQSGSVGTSSFEPDEVLEAVAKALSIATYTESDPASGLADKADLAEQQQDLDLFHNWDINAEDAIKLATECEAAAIAYDKRIKNSDGASVSTNKNYAFYANSHGFSGDNNFSRHSISCSVVGQEQDSMEVDHEYTVARDPQDLLAANKIGIAAATKAVRRLQPRKIASQKVPVIFSAHIARGLLGSFLSAVSGGSLYRKTSFLLDKKGEQIFAKHINVKEDPFIKKAFASCNFDSEGVMVKPRDLIVDGVLQDYLLSSYSARKLGLHTTGNAGGPHNIIFSTQDLNFEQLLQQMGTGLLVTDVMGQGVNLTTGDYSRGAAGFWVENGEVQYPVSEITIANNLKDMYMNIVAIANDVDKRGGLYAGSVLLEQMTISGV